MDLTEITHTSLLSIYLNDHLAGATAGVLLVERTAQEHQGTPAGPPLSQLAAEIAEDRQSLLDIMSTLEVEVQQYKLVAAWVAERVGRLKLNGHLLSRSPLSSLVELEGLKLGVEGKLSLWASLRALADTEARLDKTRLDELIARGEDQSQTLEKLRLAAAVQALA